MKISQYNLSSLRGTKPVPSEIPTHVPAPRTVTDLEMILHTYNEEVARQTYVNTRVAAATSPAATYAGCSKHEFSGEIIYGENFLI
jgi:hypothetical protein